MDTPVLLYNCGVKGGIYSTDMFSCSTNADKHNREVIIKRTSAILFVLDSHPAIPGHLGPKSSRPRTYQISRPDLHGVHMSFCFGPRDTFHSVQLVRGNKKLVIIL